MYIVHLKGTCTFFGILPSYTFSEDARLNIVPFTLPVTVYDVKLNFKFLSISIYNIYTTSIMYISRTLTIQKATVGGSCFFFFALVFCETGGAYCSKVTNSWTKTQRCYRIINKNLISFFLNGYALRILHLKCMSYQ